jgi:thiol:disulfide interchange protein DsbC
VNDDNTLTSTATQALQQTVKKIDPTQHVELDPIQVDELKSNGFQSVIIKNDSYSRRYITNNNGSILIAPNAFYTVNNGIITSIKDVFTQKEFNLAKNNPNWPSHKLPENVTKKGDLWVFSDPTCGYCKKVEHEIDDYLSKGIQVHYIPYPRAGITNKDNQGYRLWKLAVCSTEDNKAEVYRQITLGNADKYATKVSKDNPDCEKTIEMGYKLGGRVGLEGTPLIIAEPTGKDMTVINGYNSATDIISKVFP